MVIVSQDKKITVENLNLGIREGGEYNKNYTIYNTEIGEDLGEYKTEERAKEVLQEITNAYSDFNYYKSIIDKKEQIEKGIKIYQKYRTLDVYKMPED